MGMVQVITSIYTTHHQNKGRNKIQNTNPWEWCRCYVYYTKHKMKEGPKYTTCLVKRLKCRGADFWVLNIFPKNAQLSPLGIYNSRPWNSHKHVSSEIDQFWIFFLFGPLISLLILLLLTGRMTIVFLNFQFSISAGGCTWLNIASGSYCICIFAVFVFVYLENLYLCIWRICSISQH